MMRMNIVRYSLRAVGPLLAALMIVGCEQGDTNLVVPSAAQVQEHYEYGGELAVDMSGNVAQVMVAFDRDRYRMGGRVWAMASPYIFLFSSATKNVFDTYSGLGGVRVIVRLPDGSVLAEALLERGTLNDLTWQRALNVAGQARAEGTESPGYMRDLVSWGEEHTEFSYNPDHIETP